MSKYLQSKPGSIEEIAANMSKYATESEYQQMFKKELEKAGKGIGAMTPAEKKAFFNKIDSKYKAKNEETINEKKNYKRDSNFFVNDKTDTLKKMSGRQGYNKSTLTDYLAQKSNKKENDVYFDDTDLVYKSKTVLKNAETKTVDQMLKALQKEAVDNPYAVGMAQAMKSTGDKPPLKKATITKAHDIAKSIEKDQKEEVKEARWEIEGRVSYKGISSEDSFHMVIDAPNEKAVEAKVMKELDKARDRRKIGPGGGGSVEDFDIEYIERTTDKLSSPESGPMMNSYDPKLKEDFFVNDKKDTLKKFSGRIGYNKSTLTDYLAKKTNKNKNDVYFDDTELVYKDKTVLRNAETKTVDQMLQALRKEEVHPHVKKMVKDGESDEKIKKMHPELKDDELEKLKETHMSTAKAQNQKQKEVGGEKEPIKTPKNEWKTFAMMAAELREKKEEKEDKKEMQAGDDTRDKGKKTMTGQIATSPEMNPKVDYKY